MKHVQFRSLEQQDRFQLDDQWWIKVDRSTAKHSTFEALIDVDPRCQVLVRGEEAGSDATVASDSHTNIRKRDWMDRLE